MCSRGSITLQVGSKDDAMKKLLLAGSAAMSLLNAAVIAAMLAAAPSYAAEQRCMPNEQNCVPGEAGKVCHSGTVVVPCAPDYDPDYDPNWKINRNPPPPPPPPPPSLTNASGTRIWATGTNVVITGQIEANDYEAFVDTVLPETKTIYLNSPGGHLAPALKIAIMIRERDYETVVGSHSVCASACAVIWLSGNERRMLPGSRIGLHSARAKEDPTWARSAFGTTQMTNYLLSLGPNVPEAIISFIEKTEPKAMHYIGVTEATELGLLKPRSHEVWDEMMRALFGKPQIQIIGNQTWMTMETVQCGSARVVVWANANDPTNNYYGVTGDPFKGARVQNLVIKFPAGETFLNGKPCTIVQLGSG